MKKAITFTQDTTIEHWARRVRMALQLTQQDLTNMCGVPQEEVDLFEHNLPIPLENKLKLLRVLWVIKSNAKPTSE